MAFSSKVRKNSDDLYISSEAAALALGDELGQRGAHAVEAGDVLLHLAPGAHEGDGAQVLEAQGAGALAPGGAAGDVEHAVIAERGHLLQVGEEERILLEAAVGFAALRRQLREQAHVLGGEVGRLGREELVLQPGGEELLHVEAGRVGRAEVGADGLALHGELDLGMLDVGAEGAVELVGVAAAPRRRAAAAVEEHHLHARFAGGAGQIALGLVDGPVGGHVAAVLGAVREAEHDVLLAAAPLEVRGVGGLGVEPAHDALGMLQILDGLEEGHHVEVHGAGGPSRQAGQGQHLQHVGGALGVADDVAVQAAGPVGLLDGPGGIQGGQGVGGQGVRQPGGQPDLEGRAGPAGDPAGLPAATGSGRRSRPRRRCRRSAERAGRPARISPRTWPCTRLSWRRSREAKWKPKIRTLWRKASRRSRNRPACFSRSPARMARRSASISSGPA